MLYNSYDELSVEPEPTSECEYLEIINSTKPSPMMEWWKTNMQPLIDKLDEQLEGKDIYA